MIKKLASTLGLSGMMIFAALTSGLSVEASAKATRTESDIERIRVKTVDLKFEPIGAKSTEDDLLKSQEDRVNAINQALNKSLDERAKSQLSYERTKSRVSNRAERPGQSSQRLDTRLDLDSRETRAQTRAETYRAIREETKREQRLNWLSE